MKRTHYKYIIIMIFVFLFCPSFFYGFEEEIILGREDNWMDFVTFTDVIKQKGKWDTFDLTLDDAEGQITPFSDLLLHFNTPHLIDETGHYTLNSKKIMISYKNPVFGTGSGLFERDIYTLSLSPSSSAYFSPGTLWEDFTIQFWMQPLTLCDSEIILSWNGSRLSGDTIQNQSVHCTLKNRMCTWEFKNFFLSEPGEEHILILSGLTPLLPRQWHHHMIRFDSTIGMVEYLVDGNPESIEYTTKGKEEGKTIHLPYIGEIFSSDIKLGEYYTGLIDEFSISGEFVNNGIHRKYENIKGKAMSKVFDTKHTGSLLKKISAIFTKPEQTEISFYYRMADTVHLWNDLGGEWIQFVPGEQFTPGSHTMGRYIQLMVEFFPDGSEAVAPSLSSLTITYEPDLPPPPPPDVFAIAGDRKVTLYWKKVNNRDVAGYEIYYGERPGYYYENGPGEKTIGRTQSPVNAGNVTEFEMTGLENGKIYYFAVVAYDNSTIPHKSIFSKEVYARPSGLHE